jgi:flagellar hook protein FlgE
MSFQQGLSGLNASSKNLSVIGNNIANANTFGAKTSRAEFADMYAAALNGAGTNNVGIGVNLGAVSQQFTQGNITTTDNPMDLAINGAGFFQITDEKSPAMYTRNGQFKVDRDGFIVNNNKMKLMGYQANDAGVVQSGGRPVALKLNTEGVAPSPTDLVTLKLNLDSRLPATGKTAAPGIDFADATTYNNATSLTVYDVRGQDVALGFYFQKSDAAAAAPAPAGSITWNVFATANGVPVGGVPAVPVATLVYPADGSAPLGPPIALGGKIPIPSITPGPNANGAAIVPMTNVTLNLESATQFGAAFGVTDIAQNGYAAGQLTALEFEATGILVGRYSNGRTSAIGQLELATFRNPQGLQPVGNNAWVGTHASGDPVPGTPGAGNMGVLQAGALEESNVDLTGELVNMITAQRIYQANAQTIKAQDQVLQTLVNLR